MHFLDYDTTPKIVKNGQNWSKWSKLVKSGQNGQNWSKLVKNNYQKTLTRIRKLLDKLICIYI